MAAPRIDFVELPCSDTESMQAFYSRAFDFDFTAFGPTYACTMTGDVDLGFQADQDEVTAAPLPVIQVPDLDAAFGQVADAGGQITREIFTFPGGRRFHFRDPGGNELAAHQPG